jgi:hypothetical protein
MREVVDGINGIRHSEEAAQRLSRRTHSADPTDRKFFHTPESGILYLSGAYWIPALRMASPRAGQKRDRWASAGMTIFGVKLAFPNLLEGIGSARRREPPEPFAQRARRPASV